MARLEVSAARSRRRTFVDDREGEDGGDGEEENGTGAERPRQCVLAVEDNELDAEEAGDQRSYEWGDAHVSAPKPAASDGAIWWRQTVSSHNEDAR